MKVSMWPGEGDYRYSDWKNKATSWFFFKNVLKICHILKIKF